MHAINWIRNLFARDRRPRTVAAARGWYGYSEDLAREGLERQRAMINDQLEFERNRAIAVMGSNPHDIEIIARRFEQGVDCGRFEGE